MSIREHVTPGALDGVRVLDFTGVVAGPYCTRLMADMGAQVVKIESPIGDFLRALEPRRQGKSTYFGQLNAGKQSISVDLKNPQAVELALDLASKCDVLVQNFRPGVLRKFGLGYAEVSARKPDIIYCNMSGFGQEGPAADYAAYAPIIHATAGLDLAMLDFQDGMDRPMNGSIAFADYLTGVHSTAAITSALFRRERTGHGEELDIAMTEVVFNIMAYELQKKLHPEPMPQIKYRAIKAKDGYFVVNPFSAKNFADLISATGHPEWLEQYPLNVPNWIENWDNLMLQVEKWAADYSAEECETLIRDSGCPVARFRTMDEALQDDQAEFRGSSLKIDDGAGPFLVPNTPLRMNNAEARIRDQVSDLGQDNEAILHDWLGMSAGDIETLTKDGVLVQPAPHE